MSFSPAFIAVCLVHHSLHPSAGAKKQHGREPGVLQVWAQTEKKLTKMCLCPCGRWVPVQLRQWNSWFLGPGSIPNSWPLLCHCGWVQQPQMWTPKAAWMGRERECDLPSWLFKCIPLISSVQLCPKNTDHSHSPAWKQHHQSTHLCSFPFFSLPQTAPCRMYN